MTEEIYNQCGSTACVCGHGPLAGIEALAGEEWPEYSSRVFGVELNRYGSTYGLLWEWLFSGNWTGVDNTLSGAITRILFFLEYDGVPKHIEIKNRWRNYIMGND